MVNVAAKLADLILYRSASGVGAGLAVGLIFRLNFRAGSGQSAIQKQTRAANAPG